VSFIAQMRGSVPPAAQAEDDDVIDPYKQSDEIYEQSAAQIVPAVGAIADLMRSAVGNG
jgi:protein-tyrosine phosphatase